MLVSKFILIMCINSVVYGNNAKGRLDSFFLFLVEGVSDAGLTA